MIDRARVIQNDHPQLTVGDLDPLFVAAITESQTLANKGWAPDATDLIDRRIVECPDCGASGMNTCWGYWAFECGAEILSDGEPSEPCGAATTAIGNRRA